MDTLKPFSEDISTGSEYADSDFNPGEWNRNVDQLNKALREHQGQQQGIDEGLKAKLKVKTEEGIKNWDSAVKRVADYLGTSSEVINDTIYAVGSELIDGERGSRFTPHEQETLINLIGVTKNQIKKILNTKGQIPPWYKGRKDITMDNIIEAIKNAGISPTEGHHLFNKILDQGNEEEYTKREKLILKAMGWSESNIIPFGEYYHRDVGWY